MTRETKIKNLLNNLLYLQRNNVEVNADNIYTILTHTDDTLYYSDLSQNPAIYDKEFLNKLARELINSTTDLTKFFPVITKKFNYKKQSLFSKKALIVKNDPNGKYLYLDQGNTDRNTEYKTYISLKEDNFLDNIQKIYKFIVSNGLNINSKISRRTRSDNLVVRIEGEDNLKNFINFINENIKVSDTNENNPFTINDGIVALAKDTDKSYNFEVAILINSFIQILTINNRKPNKDELLNLFKLHVTENKVGFKNDEINRLIYGALNNANGNNEFFKILNSKDYHNIDNIRKSAELENNKREIQNQKRELIQLTIYRALYSTYEKHGINGKVNPLAYYIYHDNCDAFTSSNQARANILKLGQDVIIEFFGKEDLNHKIIEFDNMVKDDLKLSQDYHKKLKEDNIIQNDEYVK